jgi:MFS family permease
VTAAGEDIRDAPDLLSSETLDASRLRNAFWGVMLSFLIHGLIVGTWVSRIASIKTALNITDGALGIALLGAAIGSVAAIPCCGWIVTRYGGKNATAWTSVGFCLALILPALSINTGTLFAALLVYGAMAGANDVAINAQAVATEKRLRSHAMSRFHAMFSVGGIIAASMGGLIAGQGMGPLAHLGLAAGTILIVAILMSRLMLDTHDGAARREPIRIRQLPRVLVALSAIGFCIFLSEGAIADWTAVYLRQVLGASEALAPVGYAVFSAAMAVFRFGGDALTARLGRARTIRFGALIAALGMTGVVIAPSPYWAMAGFAAAGAGFSSIIPLVFAAGGRIEGMSEGAGVATVSGFGYLGFLVGPPAIGFVSEITSLRGGLAVLVVLSVAAMVMVSAVDRGASNPLRSSLPKDPLHP